MSVEHLVTPEQRLLVQISLDKVRACSPSPVALFYERLFELDPALRPLFRCDVEAQERRMLESLASLVEALDTPELFRGELAALGRRHVAYGVEPHHYETVGEALMWAMEQSLGATFTPDVRGAWGQLYRAIAEGMLRPAA